MHSVYWQSPGACQKNESNQKFSAYTYYGFQSRRGLTKF